MEHDKPIEESRPENLPLPKADCRGRLKAMGVVQIIIGSLCCLLMLLVLAGALIGRAFAAQVDSAPTTSLAASLSSLGVYGLAAVFFFIVGVGSLRARRWVRPLVLSFMWPTLIFGVFAFTSGFFILPPIFDAMPLPEGPNPTLQRAILSAVQVVIQIFLFVAVVVIPAIHVLIYHPVAIKKTCETFDTTRRFTDSCPTPVFGIVVSLVSIGIMQLFTLGFCIVIFFGVVLTGKAAAGILIVESLACGLLAYFVFRCRPAAWWGTLAFMVYLSARNGIALLLVDFQDIFQIPGLLNKESADIMQTAFSGIPIGPISALFWGIAGLSAAAYLVYTKKYFR